MGEATERFFESLPSRATALLRDPVSGTIQVDLTADGRTDHWYVVLRTGAIWVSRERKAADAVWHSSVRLFDRLVTGEAQAVAGLLRNEITLSGNITLFMLFRRFFPSPPGVRDPREAARERAGHPGVGTQTGRPG